QPPSAFKTRESQNFFNRKLVSLKESNRSQNTFDADAPEKIQVGMQVEHQRFGEGKVINIEGVTPNIKATVFFKSGTQKQLLLKFAKLKIIG
ncbi:MAG TPA: ATP-dependent DNA helicase, partial [Draconibacterium sp.]|nr:ATP-dependent DNA helicase [Draconibacterium sp.]